jgi:virginiamycin A acetyltransferase
MNGKKILINSTKPIIMFPISKVTVGKDTYGELDIRTFSDPNESVKIGSLCSIAKDVVFVAGGRHSTDFFNTFPLKAMYNLPVDRKDSFSKGPIIVEYDVWIGT